MQNKNSFTLVELILVVAIIGILASAAMVMIDPIGKIQRARDGTIEANMSKIVLALNAYYNAVGDYPTCDELITNGEIINATEFGSGCSGNQGMFTISGVVIPNNKCDSSVYPGGSSACAYRYERNAAGDAACVGIALWQTGGGTGPENNNYLLWTSGSPTNGAIARGVYHSTTFTCNL